MEKKGPDQKTKDRNYDVIDPIGEIRRYAKQLWKEAGRPDDKDWSDFFEDAEALLVRGRSAGGASGRSREKRPPAREGAIPAHVQEVIDQNENIPLAIVAASLRRELGAHDAICLSIILRTNELVLHDTKSIGPFGEGQVAGILAALTNEYDRFFLEQAGTTDFLAIPIRDRMSYWEERMRELNKVDKPLSYNDLNTINRLEREMIAAGKIKEFVQRPQTPELS